MNNSPCWGCKDRNETCHSCCEKYLSYKQDNDENREKLAEARRSRNDLRSYHVELARKIRKRKGKFA